MFRRKDRLMRAALRSEVVVTTLDNDTFRGLLAEVDDKVVVLVNSRVLLDSQTAPQPVDGALYLERRRVAYIQRPEGLKHADQ